MGLLQEVAPKLQWDKFKSNLKNTLKHQDLKKEDQLWLDEHQNDPESKIGECLKIIEHFEAHGDEHMSKTVASAAAMVQRVFERLNFIKESAIHDVLFADLEEAVDKKHQESPSEQYLKQGPSGAATTGGAATSATNTRAASGEAVAAVVVDEDGEAGDGEYGLGKPSGDMRSLAVANGFHEENRPSKAMAQYASDSTLRPIIYALSGGKYINVKSSDGAYFHSFENRGHIKHLYDAKAAFSQDEVKSISSQAKSASEEYQAAVAVDKSCCGSRAAKQRYKDAVMKIFFDAGYRFMGHKLIAQMYQTLYAFDVAHRRLHRYLPFELVTNFDISSMPIDTEATPIIRQYTRILGLYRLCFDYTKDNEWASIMQDSFPIFRDYAAAQLFNRESTKDVVQRVAEEQVQHDFMRSKQNKRFFGSPELLDNDAGLLYECRLHHVTHERALKFENFLALVAYINERNRFISKQRLSDLPLVLMLEN